MIFRSKRKLSDEERVKTKEALKDDAKEGIIVLPDYIEVVGNNDYQVWSKGEYIKYMLTKGAVRSGTLDIRWKKVSKGYNFIIAIYREEIKGYDLLSVEYFNRLFGENNKEETVATIKEEDIKIKDISLESSLISTDSEIVAFVIAGVRVSFEYSQLKADIFIETDRVLTIKEIKQKIINNAFRKQKDVKEDM